MSNVHFDIVELQILAIYECVTRKETMEYIEESLLYMDEDEAELMEIMERVRMKLMHISDAAFAELDLQSYLVDDSISETGSNLTDGR